MITGKRPSRMDGFFSMHTKIFLNLLLLKIHAMPFIIYLLTEEEEKKTTLDLGVLISMSLCESVSLD